MNEIATNGITIILSQAHVLASLASLCGCLLEASVSTIDLPERLLQLHLNSQQFVRQSVKRYEIGKKQRRKRPHLELLL